MAEKVEILNIDTSTQQKSINDLKNEIKSLKDALGELKIGSDEYNETAQKLNEAQEQLTVSTQATKAASVEYSDSINGMRIQLQQMQAELRNMSTTDPKFEEKAAQAAALSDKLNAANQQIGNYKDNIGRYAESFQTAMSAMGMSASGIIAPIKGVSTAMKGLAANPVGAVIMAIVVALKAAKLIFDQVKASVERNETSMNNMKKAMAPLKAVIDVVRNAFDAFIETISKVAAAVGEAVTAVMEFFGIADEEAAKEMEVANAQQEADKIHRENIVANAQLELEASELHAKAADKENYSAEERLKMINEYAEKQKEIAANNLKEAQAEYDALKAQAATGANNKEMNDKLAEAQAKLLQVQKAYNDELRSTTREINKVQNEIKSDAASAAAAQKAAHEKAAAAAKKHAEELKAVRDKYKEIFDTIRRAHQTDFQNEIEDIEKEKKERLAAIDARIKKDKEYAKQTKQIEKDRAKIADEAEQKIKDATITYGEQIQDLKNQLYNLTDTADNQTLFGVKDKWDKTIAQQKKNLEALVKAGVMIQEEADGLIEDLQAKADEALANAAEDIRKSNLSKAIENALVPKDSFTKDLTQKIKDALEAGTIDETLATELLTKIGLGADQIEQALADVFANKLAKGVDEALSIFDEFASTLDGKTAAVAEGISGLGAAFGELAVDIKKGEKGWKSYGKVAAMALSAVGTMLSGLAEEQDTDTEEGFEKQKKLSYASTVMNMLSGIMAAWTSAMALPAPASFIVGAAETAATAGLGAAQLAQIAKTKFEDSSSSSSSASSSALTSITAPVDYTTDVQGASAETTVGDTKVYVLESDITSTQNKVNVAQSEATF